jgi:YVTN family beta-propeller protein
MSVIDAASHKVTATVPVGDEPHGVSTEPTGRFIFVANTGEDSVSVIDADTLKEQKRLVAGRGPWPMALAFDGKRLYAGSILAHIAPFQEPHHAEVTVIDAERGLVVDRAQFPGANMMRGMASVPGRRVALATLMRTKNLVPLTRLMQGWTITNGLGIIRPDGQIDEVLLDEQDNYFPDPTGVAVSPDGRFALVTSGGANQVAVVDVPALLELINKSSARERRAVLPNHLGMSRRFVVKRIDVGANPRGVVFSPDGARAYVADALDDTVTVIDTSNFTVAGCIDLGGPDEITPVRWGEQLFHNAANAYGRQFSCRSCHPDGHINGLTFDIEPDGVGFAPVDNRTLRGIVDTDPFKWEGTNPSLRRQCGPRLAVFFTRLEPYTPDELEAVTRYMCTIQRPPNRYRRPDGLTVAQRRGKRIFERTRSNTGQPIPRELRCSTCHSGAYGNDTQPRVVGTTMWLDAPVSLSVADLHDPAAYFNLGVYFFHDTGTATKAFDVPHLNNIYDSAPYLHNGSAATLEEIWTRFNAWDEHGITNDLTRKQLNDLITYLKAR